MLHPLILTKPQGTGKSWRRINRIRTRLRWPTKDRRTDLERKNLASKRLGEAHKFVGDVFDSLSDFSVRDALAVESVADGKGEPRNNDAAKIEHETVGVRHHRHVTRVASGSANEPDDFVFPRVPGELDHVLGRSRDVVIVNRRRNEDAVSVFNGRGQFFRTGHAITLVCVAERQIHFTNVDPVAIDFLFLQMRKRDPSHAAAVTIGITAGANDKMFWHWQRISQTDCDCKE